jgi:UDP-N-acetylmuramyl tripeptide synthase
MDIVPMMSLSICHNVLQIGGRFNAANVLLAAAAVI